MYHQCFECSPWVENEMIGVARELECRVCSSSTVGKKCKDMQGKGNGERVMFMRTVMLQLAAVNTADGRAPADLGGAELDLKTFSSISALSHKLFFSC